MPISQILDLRRRLADQAVVPLAQVTLLVFPLAVKDSENGKNTDANLTAQVDCVADRVAWSVVGSICPGGFC